MASKLRLRVTMVSEDESTKITFLSPDREQKQAIFELLTEIDEGTDGVTMERFKEICEESEALVLQLCEKVVCDGETIPTEELTTSGIVYGPQAVQAIRDLSFRQWVRPQNKALPRS